jgi:putative DNA primase/helicase
MTDPSRAADVLKVLDGLNGKHQDGLPPDRVENTDAGNARRMVHHHSDRLQYVPGKGWHAYDGRRWAPDTTRAVMRAAKETARAILREAHGAPDEETRKDLAKWAVRSQSEPRLRAMIALAESETEFVLTADRLDRHPMLLNARNGTIDLDTGELRPHNPGDHITKLANVTYDHLAQDDILDSFLFALFADRPEDAPSLSLLLYLQRLAGYCLTGDTTEEKFFFVHGMTATGKSTFLDALGAMMGDYATVADFETFLKRRGDAPVRNDVARLAGARLVTSLEVDEGKRLAEGLVKTLTGGDTITARFLYSEAFQFKPQFKLFLAANSRPRVNASDTAMWRRIDLIPFTNSIPEHKRDPAIKRHLVNDPGARSALLAWAIEGCINWQRQRITTPNSVKAYTADYRKEDDVISEWLQDCCELAPTAIATAADLNDSYTRWAQVTRVKNPLSAIAFAAQLKEHGLTGARTKKARLWHGIQLKGDG